MKGLSTFISQLKSNYTTKMALFSIGINGNLKFGMVNFQVFRQCFFSYLLSDTKYPAVNNNHAGRVCQFDESVSLSISLSESYFESYQWYFPSQIGRCTVFHGGCADFCYRTTVVL